MKNKFFGFLILFLAGFITFPHSVFAQELPYSDIKSVTWYDTSVSPSESLTELSAEIPKMKSAGFNTVWLVNQWSNFDPQPFGSPHIYSTWAFPLLLQTLQTLKANNMKAIIGLNYLGQGWSPQGIDACSWITHPDQYAAFVTYTKDFLTQIKDYSDMVYILVFSENAIPCNLNVPENPLYQVKNAREAAADLRSTLGNLPNQLPQDLRARFKIGFHDYALINFNWAQGESPIANPNPFNFLSMVAYATDGVDTFTTATDAQVKQIISGYAGHFKALYPTTPLIIGESGASSCGGADDRQSRLIKDIVSFGLENKYGFNIWGWKNAGATECSNPVNGGLAITNADGSLKPAAYAIKTLVSTDIQQQINSLPEAGGTVNLPAGEYLLSSSNGTAGTYPNGTPIQTAILINKDNVTLQGQGASTILKLAPHTKMRAISITGKNVTIKNLVIDGNKAERGGSVPWPNGDVVDTLLFSDTTSNITIEGVESRNGIEDGMGFWKSQNVTVKDSFSHDNGTVNAGGAGISLSGDSNSSALNNRIENNTATGIWSSFDANKITISGNTIKNNRSGGITVGGGTLDAGLGHNNSGFTVENNILSQNGIGGFATITVFASSNGTIKRNRIDSSYYDSIQIDGADTYLTDSWNLIQNVCPTGNSHDLGIRNIGHSQNIHLYSNFCPTYSNQLTPPGDVNLDGVVNVFDYNQIASDYKKTGNLPSDLDISGTVDISDYNILLANFGK